MKKTDYFSRYIALAPLQLALWRTPEVVALAKFSLKEPILDLACGDGVFTTVLLAGERKEVYGLDIDRLAVKLAKKTGTFKQVLEANAEKIPFKSQSFSTIISNSSFEHFDDIDRVLREVSRVLKKGGRFALIVPSVFLDEYWLTSVMTRRVPFGGRFLHKLRNRIFGHKHILEKKELIDKLKNANLKVVSYVYINHKSACRISDIFWPLRFPQLILTGALKRPILFPRGPALFLGNLLGKVLRINELKINKEQGSAILFELIRK